MDTATRIRQCEAQQRQHQKLCAICTKAGRKVDQYCDLGYAIARALHQLRQRLDREAAEAAGRLVPLPGMEQLGA